MKIYTKTGDDGTTGLFAGPRVAKDHPRIEAYGAVDELSALLGVVIGELLKLEGHPTSGTPPTTDRAALRDELCEGLRNVQSDLFSIGAELATPDPQSHNMCLLDPQRVAHLEQWIDRADEQLEPLRSFILPGGSPGSALLHLARTVCRRAERNVIHWTHAEEGQDCRLIVVYLNRLSDLLFVLARQVNAWLGCGETTWQPPAAGRQPSQ